MKRECKISSENRSFSTKKCPTLSVQRFLEISTNFQNMSDLESVAGQAGSGGLSPSTMGKRPRPLATRGLLRSRLIRSRLSCSGHQPLLEPQRGVRPSELYCGQHSSYMNPTSANPRTAPLVPRRGQARSAKQRQCYPQKAKVERKFSVRDLEGPTPMRIIIRHWWSDRMLNMSCITWFPILCVKTEEATIKPSWILGDIYTNFPVGSRKRRASHLHRIPLQKNQLLKYAICY